MHSEANARRIAIVESCFGSAGVVSLSIVYSNGFMVYCGMQEI